MQHWWWFIVNLSKRDQLSFNYVAWKNKFSFDYLQGDARRNNDWFYMAAKTDKSIAYTLLKYKEMAEALLMYVSGCCLRLVCLAIVIISLL